MLGTVSVHIPDFTAGSGGGGSTTRSIFAARVVALYDRSIATEISTGDTVDGVVLAAGDRVLLAFQVDDAENGLYVVGAGAATRDPDLSTADQFIGGIRIGVALGNFGEGSRWVLRNTSPVVDTDPVLIDQELTGSPLEVRQHDDWLGTTNESESNSTGAMGWVRSSSGGGTGSADPTALETSINGPVRGLTTSGPDQFIGITTGRPGDGWAYCEDPVIEHHWFQVLLGETTDEQRNTFGWCDGSSTFPQNGAYFQRDESSANWQVQTSDAGSSTVTDTGVPIVGGQWYDCHIWCREGRTLFVLDREFAAEHTTDLPSGTGALIQARMSGYTSVSAAEEDHSFFWSFYSIARHVAASVRTA